MWCFIRFLPLLVGNTIPQNDRKWECILLLRDMLFYVCSPALNREHILIMSDIIEEFHESYINCFPEEDVKPNFHYTLHYPKLTQMFGPLVHLQTLLFEGKHNYFKELVFRTKNRKNICKSLAERHQYYQCTFNTGGHFLSDGNLESTVGFNVPICLLDDQLRQLLIRVVQGEDIFLCKSVKYFGIVYWRDTSVVYLVDNFNMEFSRIENCAIIHGVPYLICRKLQTVGFERHFHGFRVSESNQYNVLKVADLKEPNPLGIYPQPSFCSRQNYCSQV